MGRNVRTHEGPCSGARVFASFLSVAATGAARRGRRSRRRPEAQAGARGDCGRRGQARGSPGGERPGGEEGPSPRRCWGPEWAKGKPRALGRCPVIERSPRSRRPRADGSPLLGEGKPWMSVGGGLGEASGRMPGDKIPKSGCEDPPWAVGPAPALV